MPGKRMRLIRNSMAYTGPSQNAGQLILFGAGAVFEVVPDSSMPDDRFFRFYYGDRSAYILSVDAVPTMAPPSPPKRPPADVGVTGEPRPPRPSPAIPWPEVMMWVIGLGMICLGLFIVVVGARAGCAGDDDRYCGAATIIVVVLFGLVVSLLGTSVVIAAIRERGDR